MLGRLCAIAGLMVVLAPIAVHAQDAPPQPVQELFLTELVYPQEKGEVQLTFSTLVDRSRPDLSALMSGSIEYGLTDRWQIEAAWDGVTHFHHSPFAHLRTARGSIGTKYSFMNIAHSPVHAAVGIDAEFPDTGAFDESEGEDGIELEPFVAMAIDLPHRVAVFGSAGTSFEPAETADLIEGGRPDDRGTLSAGGLVAFHHATVALEYTNRSDGLPWRLDGSALVTPSLILHPGGNWELGVGMPIGVRSGAHKPGVALNVIKEF